MYSTQKEVISTEIIDWTQNGWWKSCCSWLSIWGDLIGILVKYESNTSPFTYCRLYLQPFIIQKKGKINDVNLKPKKHFAICFFKWILQNIHYFWGNMFFILYDRWDKHCYIFIIQSQTHIRCIYTGNSFIKKGLLCSHIAHLWMGCWGDRRRSNTWPEHRRETAWTPRFLRYLDRSRHRRRERVGIKVLFVEAVVVAFRNAECVAGRRPG